MACLTGKSAAVESMVGQDLTGKVLVLRSKMLAPRFRKREYQFWRAESGFGCDPTCSGTCVYAVCLADGEHARWERGDFLGLATAPYGLAG